MQPTQKLPTVLVVDDNRATVEMLARIFSIHQFNVLRAYNGREAIAIARTEQPDLIILDVMMPEVNGYEVIAELRQDPSTAAIPTIFLTAKDSPADVERGMQLGADDYIPKPADQRELIARSRSKIEAKRYRDALMRKTLDLQQLLELATSLNKQLDLPDMAACVAAGLAQLRAIKAAALLYQTETDTVYAITSEEAAHQYANVLQREPLSAVLQALGASSAQTTIQHVDDGLVQFTLCLFDESEIRGVLRILAEPAFADELQTLYEGAAQQAALALKNAASFQLRRNYAAELEKMVNKRTEELKNAQQLLIRSEKLASVGRLASAIAHEINNPLMPIILNLELMVEDLQQGRPPNLNDIDILATYQHATRIKRTLERILQFTRGNRAGQPVMQPVQINELLNNLIMLSKHFFARSSVEIAVSFDEAIQPVMGNADQLEQVFLNMMINARDAMPDGGKLFISTKAQPSSVIISVRDTGHGIPPEFMERIFEPFTTSKTNGSGIGLFVSHEIVSNHHGTIHVTSAPNEGTEFIVELPTNAAG